MPNVVQDVINNSYSNEPVKIFVGDIDEFYCEARDDEIRHYVWVNYRIDENAIEDLVAGKFNTIGEAESFARTLKDDFEKYDVEAVIV